MTDSAVLEPRIFGFISDYAPRETHRAVTSNPSLEGLSLDDLFSDASEPEPPPGYHLLVTDAHTGNTALLPDNGTVGRSMGCVVRLPIFSDYPSGAAPLTPEERRRFLSHFLRATPSLRDPLLRISHVQAHVEYDPEVRLYRIHADGRNPLCVGGARVLPGEHHYLNGDATLTIGSYLLQLVHMPGYLEDPRPVAALLRPSPPLLRAA